MRKATFSQVTSYSNMFASTNSALQVTISGEDKYYLDNSLAIDKIKVYIDGVVVDSISKTLSSPIPMANGQGVQYALTLRNFGEYSGVVKIEIAENTLVDSSGNNNLLKEKQ